MTEDVPFYVELAKEAGGPIVELAVGNGRVAIPVALETGIRWSAGTPLPRCSRRPVCERSRSAELELHERDMRDFELAEPAALVYCPYRALLHLPTWHDKRRVFERVAAALRPGGRFAWNTFCFDHAIAAKLDGEHQQEPSPLDALRGARQSHRHRAGRRRPISLWWVTKSEWEGLIDVAGLEVEALYGWFDRRPFDEESREFVWVARKPA